MKRIAPKFIVSLATIASASALAGCAPPFAEVAALPPAGLETPAVARAMSAASAAQAGGMLYALLGIERRESRTACPRQYAQGESFVVDAEGCTTERGVAHEGRYVITGPVITRGAPPPEGTYTIRTEGLSSRETVRCTNGRTAERANRTHYEARATMSGTRMEFTFQSVDHAVSVNPETCSTETELQGFEYRGSIDFAPAANPTVMGSSTTPAYPRMTFNGAGQFGHRRYGLVTATTENEVIDRSVCSSEALSGTTTLTAAGRTAVLTYDGATMCSPESRVPWTLDGAAQAPLDGVQCSVGRAPGAGARGRGALAMCAASLALGCAVAARRAKREGRA